MAVGNKPLKKNIITSTPDTIRCMRCNIELSSKEYYDSDSELHASIGKVPYCKECINSIYQEYKDKYKELGYANPDRSAIERICMMFDLYYSDKVFDSALKQNESGGLGTPLIATYFRHVKMYQYRKKNYDTTINEKYVAEKQNDYSMTFYSEEDGNKNETIMLSKKMFGNGFSDDDYIYLYEQYCDWTSRHECNTKAQEEVFENICLTQLQLRKAIKTGDDTKDLATQLQKWLDTGKLQPKQNSSEAVSDAQTFGTLIDKWETTRPVPEVSEELKDVDKIGQYIDVFFKGHLAKMMGLKNGISDIYDKFMDKYTVTKPEYDADEDNEALFDAIFGRDLEEEV